MRFADAAVIVAETPEIASISDSNRIIAMLNSQTQKAAKVEEASFRKTPVSLPVLVPPCGPRDETLTIEDVLEILAVPFSASSRKAGGAACF